MSTEKVDEGEGVADSDDGVASAAGDRSVLPGTVNSPPVEDFVVADRNFTIEADAHWRFIRREYETNDRIKLARMFRADTMVAGFAADADRKSMRSLLEDRGVWIVDENPELSIGKLRFSEDKMDQFWEILGELHRRADLFRFVEPEYLVEQSSSPTDDPYVNDSGSWGLHQMNFPAAWGSLSGDPVLIAVIDSGVDLAHPDLAGKIWTNAAEIAGNGVDDDNNGFVDDVNGWNSVHGNGNVQDTRGHGTAVAGIIAAMHNNALDIAGAAPIARIMPVRNAIGELSSSFDSADALTYAADNGADIANMSFGHSSLSFALDTAVDYADGKGVIMVASAGNDAQQANPNFPARFPEVISVGSLDQAGQRSGFSNYGPEVDFMAPGDGILTLRASGTSLGNPLNGRLTTISGTSFAVPYVSSAVAILLQLHPDWNIEEMVAALQVAGDKEDTWDTDTGYGVIDSAAAITAEPVLVESITPEHGSVHRNSVEIEVEVPAAATLFLAYRSVENPGNWTGLSNTSGTSFSHTWDTSSLPDGRYIIRYELASGGKRSNLYRAIRLAHSAPFFERVTEGNATRLTASDLDGDGEPELITAPFRALSVFKPHQGSLPGWPIGSWPRAVTEPTTGPFKGYGHNYGWPSCGDIDGDGQLEIAIFHAPQNNLWSETVLTVTDNQGNILPKISREFTNGRPTYHSGEGYFSPVFVDLDGDQRDEILYVSSSGDGEGAVHAIKADGKALSGWPVLLSPGHRTSYGTPATCDFDGDNSLDVALMTDQGTIEIFSASGQRLSGWPRDFDPVIEKSPFLIFADYDHDGAIELLAASRSGRMQIFEDDGSTVAGWPQTLTITDPPTVGNIDDDPELEIVIPSQNSQYIFNHDGSHLNGWPQSASSQVGTALLVDVDNDGEIDIFNTEFSQRLVCWDRHGNYLSELGFPMAVNYYGNTKPIAGDLDGDGLVEISADKYQIGLHLYQLNTVAEPGAVEHGMFHLTSNRQNRYLKPHRSVRLHNGIIERLGANIVLTGSGFLQGMVILADDIPLEILSLSPDRIEARVPDAVPDGYYRLWTESVNTGSRISVSDIVIFDSIDGDSDGDRLPNLWEKNNLLDPFDDGSGEVVNGAKGDRDLDMIPNIVEHALRGNLFSTYREDSLLEFLESADGSFHFILDESSTVKCWISTDLKTWTLVDENLDPARFTVNTSTTVDGFTEITITMIDQDAAYIHFAADPDE